MVLFFDYPNRQFVQRSILKDSDQKQLYSAWHQSSLFFILASLREEYWYYFTLNMKEIHGLDKTSQQSEWK